MRIEILQEAEDELSEAIAYYEEVEPGLGIRLQAEVRKAIQWIGRNPEIPRLRPKGYRRVNLNIFRSDFGGLISLPCRSCAQAGN